MNNPKAIMDQVKDMTVEEAKLFTCGKGCGEGFKIEPEFFRVEGFKGVNADGLPDRIDKHYLTCPECGCEYVSYYADSEMRATQERAARLLGKLERTRDEVEQGRLRYEHGKLMGQFRNRARRLRKGIEQSQTDK